MSDTKRGGIRHGEERSFLERWSRRKARSNAGPDAGERARPPVSESTDREKGRPRDEPAAVLPDLDSLGDDSDYSAFMAIGIDESVRRQALRRLFRSAKFNVIDGLDDYCRDYTQWERLGDVVTADMRHRLERLARKQQAEARDHGAGTGQEATDGQEPGHADDRLAETSDEEDGDLPVRPA